MMGLPMGDDATDYADSTDSEDLRDDQRLHSETLQDLDLMLGHAELDEFRSQMEFTQHRDKLVAHYQNVLQSIHEKESLLRYVYEALAKDHAELEAIEQEMENLERHGMDPRVLGSSLLARQFLEDQTSSDTARPSSEDWTPSDMPRHSLDNETPSDMPGGWRDNSKRSCGGRRLFDNPAPESVKDSIISEGKHVFHNNVRISGQSKVASGVQTMPELPQMASCDGSSGTIIDSALHSAFSAIAKCAGAVDDRAKHPVRLGQGSIGAALTMPALPIMNFKLEDSSSGTASGLQDDSKHMRSGVDPDHMSRKVPGNDVIVVQERAERDAAQDVTNHVTNHGVTSEGKRCFYSRMRISGQSKVASGVQTMPELPQMASFEESSGTIIDSALHSAFSAIAKCAGAIDDRAKHPVRLGQGSIGAALTMPALPIMNFKLEDSSSSTASGLQDDSKHMRSGGDLDHKSRKLPGNDVPAVQERAERDAAQDVVSSMDLLCLAKKIGLVASTDLRSHCSKSWQRPPGAAVTMPDLPMTSDVKHPCAATTMPELPTMT